MRSSTIISAMVAFVPLAMAQTSSAPSESITSMVPVGSASRDPVTMAWDNSPYATPEPTGGAAALESSMQSGMSAESMSMESGMTMSDGMPMATGSSLPDTFQGAAGRLDNGDRVWWLIVGVAAVLV
ncbi:hypothetical protein BDW02DRAFT_574988 [Decorospora gaudefroyi]|uniref:Uncharacterized protein n=1 Tax=Decorospora gaudefroyi TaxID=184978 RepID=A0A6A5K4E8_9PLEO|nr:hypothetical protein BDW02DRAFT_574988 [Decorospora gaudefroyi]